MRKLTALVALAGAGVSPPVRVPSAGRRRSDRFACLIALGVLLIALGAAALLTRSPSGLTEAQNLPYAASASVPQSPAATVPAKTKRRVTDAYGKLPLAFVPNAGQTDHSVRYYAQGAGYTFYFTDHKAVLALQKGNRGEALDLRFVGANPNAKLEGADRGTGRVNYLTGSEHHTNLPTYGRLVYRDLWPGIDMVFRGEGGKLNYAFRLRPGAKVSDIRLAYAGAQDVSLGAGGALQIDTPLGTLKDARPQSFQPIDGRRVAVDGRYALGGNSYGFSVGHHDRRKPLVIDPSLSYSTYLGGSSDEVGRAIAVDSSGAAYITGETASTDFPTTAGAFDPSANGGSDAFVTKLDPTGTGLAYSTYLGGSNEDLSRGIAVDSSGAVYVTGLTDSADFPTTAGAFDTNQNGSGFDVFVTKLDPTGSSLTYSTYLGGSSSDGGFGIAVDSAGAAYVTGFTDSADFPTTAGAFDTSYNGGLDDAFVSKLDPAGSSLTYSTYLGGSSDDVGFGIALNSAGAAYVTGRTGSTDFPTTAGAFDTSANVTGNGDGDAFVTKLDPAGSSLAYSTYLGGSSNDGAFGIALDSAGDSYVTGGTESTDFPTTAGAFDTSANGGTHAFVTKLDPTGSSLSYSTYLGGQGFALGEKVAVDSAGAAYVIGETTSTDFPTVEAFDTSYNGGEDAFVTKLDPNGLSLSYSTYLGGSSGDVGIGIALDSSGAAYVTGLTDSADFPTTAGAFDTSQNGSGDAFVTKLSATSAANNSASEQAPAGGTVSTNTTTNADDPVGTSVTTPNAGPVTISEGATTTPDPTGYSLLGQQVQITAPTASAASPLVIQFLLDSSVLPAGADPSALQVFRDGAPIPDCAPDAGDSANPDPCVATRAPNGDGGVAITVRTSQASTWNFGLHSAYAFQGFYSPIVAPPALNSAHAVSAVPLRFSLGGNQGLGIFASGYPRSHSISCNAAATDLGDDAQTTGSLSYDSKSKRYTYVWKTSKAWANSCRQFVLHLIDGSFHRANFRFTG